MAQGFVEGCASPRLLWRRELCSRNVLSRRPAAQCSSPAGQLRGQTATARRASRTSDLSGSLMHSAREMRNNSYPRTALPPHTQALAETTVRSAPPSAQWSFELPSPRSVASTSSCVPNARVLPPSLPPVAQATDHNDSDSLVTVAEKESGDPRCRESVVKCQEWVDSLPAKFSGLTHLNIILPTLSQNTPD